MRERAVWEPEELTLIEDAIADLGANEECAKFLIESIGPSIGPRMILNAAIKIIAEKGVAKNHDPSFDRYLTDAHLEWTRNKYYRQAVINGEPYVGITVIRKNLQRFSRDELLRAGLSIPLPKARKLDDWVRRKAGIKSRMLNGARLYPEKEILAYVESRSPRAASASASDSTKKLVPTSLAVASVLVEPAGDSDSAMPQQLSLPEAMTTSGPKIVTLREAVASAVTPAAGDDDDAVIRRAAQSKHRKLAAALQVAEVEEQMARAAYAKASDAHRAADKALTDFETQMAEYLTQ